MLQLIRQVRANKSGGIFKLPGRNLNKFTSPRISARIMRCSSHATRIFERCDLGRPDSPVASFAKIAGIPNWRLDQLRSPTDTLNRLGILV